MVDERAVREQPIRAGRTALPDIVQEAQLDQRVADRDVADAFWRLALVAVDVVQAAVRRLVGIDAADLSGLADPHAGVDAQQRPPKQVRRVHRGEVCLGLEQDCKRLRREWLIRVRGLLARLLGLDEHALDRIRFERGVQAVADHIFEAVVQAVELVVDGLWRLWNLQQGALVFY